MGGTRTAAVVVAVLITVGAGCADDNGGGDGGLAPDLAATVTSTTSTTAAEPAVRLDPPDGYTRHATDQWTVEMSDRLQRAGWPTFGAADENVLAVFLAVAATACNLAATSPDAADAYQADLMPSGQLDPLITVLEQAQVSNPDTLVGYTAAAAVTVAGATLCPGRGI